MRREGRNGPASTAAPIQDCSAPPPLPKGPCCWYAAYADFPTHLHTLYTSHTLHTLAFFWSACACFSLGLKKMFCADSMARMVRISSLHPRSTLAINT